MSRPQFSDKFGMENADLWEATSELIWHCIFDNRLPIWKTICLEPLCQQAETKRQGAEFLENYLRFILLGEFRLPRLSVSLKQRCANPCQGSRPCE